MDGVIQKTLAYLQARGIVLRTKKCPGKLSWPQVISPISKRIILLLILVVGAKIVDYRMYYLDFLDV